MHCSLFCFIIHLKLTFFFVIQQTICLRHCSNIFFCHTADTFCDNVVFTYLQQTVQQQLQRQRSSRTGLHFGIAMLKCMASHMYLHWLGFIQKMHGNTARIMGWLIFINEFMFTMIQSACRQLVMRQLMMETLGALKHFQFPALSVHQHYHSLRVSSHIHWEH